MVINLILEFAVTRPARALPEITDFYYASFICVDDVGFLIFIIPLAPASIIQVDMAVNKKFRFVFIQKLSEHPKSLMRKVTPIV